MLTIGSQLGLDYTDELGDNIAEYAGKFAQAGYSAEEYFQLLKNGTKNGAYNLDKVNDSINEVTTRLADGTISGAIGRFSTETQSLFEQWQNGGASQKQVIDSIVEDITIALASRKL
ncbi:MAG: phage tail tape measure protein [[Clostridium] leptum]